MAMPVDVAVAAGVSVDDGVEMPTRNTPIATYVAALRHPDATDDMTAPIEVVWNEADLITHP